MKCLTFVLSVMARGFMCSVPSSAAQTKTERPVVDANGTVHVPAFSVPLSRYMSKEAKWQFIEDLRKASTQNSETNTPIAKLRTETDDYYRPLVERARERYPVNVEDLTIGGVHAQVVTPKGGVSGSNRDRVLINLHGGGFFVGAGLGGLAESIPVASVGNIKVISVDYRMAPEYNFPAASQDVAAVYRELLKQYPANDIGIYGCSAGGILTAMAVAWLQKEEGLPSPGAIGVFGAGAYGSFSGPPADPNTWGGDSAYTARPLTGQTPLPISGISPDEISGAMDYTGNVDKRDPLASPALSPAILSKFPPTLLITGTRSWDMSAAAQTQRLLTRVGVEADLHVWDGMGHCFLIDSAFPESQEAYEVIGKFFDSHLGHGHK